MRERYSPAADQATGSWSGRVAPPTVPGQPARPTLVSTRANQATAATAATPRIHRVSGVAVTPAESTTNAAAAASCACNRRAGGGTRLPRAATDRARCRNTYAARVARAEPVSASTGTSTRLRTTLRAAAPIVVTAITPVRPSAVRDRVTASWPADGIAVTTTMQTSSSRSSGRYAGG